MTKKAFEGTSQEENNSLGVATGAAHLTAPFIRIYRSTFSLSLQFNFS